MDRGDATIGPPKIPVPVAELLLLLPPVSELPVDRFRDTSKGSWLLVMLYTDGRPSERQS